MEYKVDDIISYNEDDKTIYLQVTPTIFLIVEQ